jgi:hypothetical protein
MLLYSVLTIFLSQTACDGVNDEAIRAANTSFKQFLKHVDPEGFIIYRTATRLIKRVTPIKHLLKQKGMPEWNDIEALIAWIMKYDLGRPIDFEKLAGVNNLVDDSSEHTIAYRRRAW